MALRAKVTECQFDDQLVSALYHWSVAYLRSVSPLLVARFHARLARVRIAPDRERKLIRPMLMFVLRYTK